MVDDAGGIHGNESGAGGDAVDAVGPVAVDRRARGLW